MLVAIATSHPGQSTLRGSPADQQAIHRIPSHDTLSDVIGQIDRDAFALAFTAWVPAGLPELAGHQVAVDGKSLRGSRGADGTVHMISAFATQARLVMAAQAIPDKANEITAIPGLLALLNLAGAVVTIDAEGCQREIARVIVDQKADYVLALKENHPTLHDDIKLWLDDSDAQGHVRMHETVEKDRGRIETRRTVQFGEDTHRTRKDHSAANLGLIRRAALNLLQQDASDKRSIRRRKMRSLVDVTYREALLFRNGEAKST